MNDPTNATLSRSQYSQHFYQNPDSFLESQQNIDYAEELDYMEFKQGWFQSFSKSFWSRRVPGWLLDLIGGKNFGTYQGGKPDICIKCGCVMNQDEKKLLQGFPLLYEAMRRKAGFIGR